MANTKTQTRLPDLRERHPAEVALPGEERVARAAHRSLRGPLASQVVMQGFIDRQIPLALSAGHHHGAHTCRDRAPMGSLVNRRSTTAVAAVAAVVIALIVVLNAFLLSQILL